MHNTHVRPSNKEAKIMLSKEELNTCMKKVCLNFTNYHCDCSYDVHDMHDGF